jgi:predicted acylesterase/phospholipase RssA
MKGGITSGVIYPLAVSELSKDYRLRNLGGTSAGAIAAAAAAAAEYGRQNGSGSAFAGLEGLPEWLGQHLTDLFQPSSSTASFFEVVLAGTKFKGRQRLEEIGKTVLHYFAYPAAAGALPGALLIVAGAFNGGWILGPVILAGLVLMLIGALLAITLVAASRLVRAVPDNYFGLCTGYRREERVEPQPLTTWLADKLDELAGKDPSQPLTFGDLWGTPYPADEHQIELKMITTCLTQGRPLSMPWQSKEFLFKVEEFRDLFPARIVDWMVEHARGASSSNPDLLFLPAPAELPVVVAARMSLSFPLLISAVPLWAIDYSRLDVPREALEPERCWFSDGGITSNFPLHFFDSPVPRWPTFAIDLRPLGRDMKIDPADQRSYVDLPYTNDDGRLARWTLWDGQGRAKQLVAFFSSILDTSRNWVDNAQARVPGYRDRIVHIAHEADEGGLNLTMPPAVITRLGRRGAIAAERLKARFVVPPRDPSPLTWDNQRWVRYRTYMALLEGDFANLRHGYLDPDGNDRGMDELSLHPPSYKWKNWQGERARQATSELLELIETWSAIEARFDYRAPRPKPVLQVDPKI